MAAIGNIRICHAAQHRTYDYNKHPLLDGCVIFEHARLEEIPTNE